MLVNNRNAAKDSSTKFWLTQRERNILAHLANNHSTQEIARLEMLAPSSVKWYIHQIYAKLGVKSRVEVLLRARDLERRENLPNLPKNNLPRQFTSFIGREQEITQLLGLVRSNPLVTLTGSGGTGKTRLALQAAARALDDFPGGIWFIDLAPLADPSLVPMVAATALGIHGIARESALLVLDNCEHLIAAAAELAHALLSSCPELHILGTSREILGLEGEQALRCPPLALPDPTQRTSFSQLAQFEAIRLFSERAADASPNFHLDEANAAMVQQICLHLDGIPLAIELAAARLRLLSIQQIAARLENIFYLLTGGGRSALPRHKTLKAMIDWSYDLLPKAERQLLCRLSVFSGGWTLEAAEMVCSGPDLPHEEILGLLAQLVDKSLVNVQAGRDGEPRYRLLEMIRQYAHNRLQETGAVDAARERHLDYFRELAVQAESHLRGKDSRWWLERLGDKLPNIRMALEWALAGSVVKGLRLAGGLYWFWFVSKHRLEGLDWLERLLAAEQAGRAARAEQGAALVELQVARGKALDVFTYMGMLVNRDGTLYAEEALAIFQSLNGLYPQEAAYALFVKENLKSEKDFGECLEVARAIDYRWLMAEILLQKGFLAVWAGDLEEAQLYASEAFGLSEGAGDFTGMAGMYWTQGTLQFMQGRLTEAIQLFQASLDAYTEAGNLEMVSFVRRFPAWLALAQGQFAEASACSQVQLDESQAMNVPWVMADALGFLAWAALSAGDEREAGRYCEEAFKLSGRVADNLLAVARYVMARVMLGRGEFARAETELERFVRHNYHNWPPVQLGIQLFGLLALAQSANEPQQARRAVLLFGAQDGLAPCLMNVISPPEREAYHAALAAARTLLSPAEFAAAFSQGQALTTRQAIEYALGEG